MRGAVVVTALVDGGLTVTAGEEFLATYQFNTKVAEHRFCTRCGINTHHKRRGNPDEACAENNRVGTGHEQFS